LLIDVGQPAHFCEGWAVQAQLVVEPCFVLVNAIGSEVAATGAQFGWCVCWRLAEWNGALDISSAAADTAWRFGDCIRIAQGAGSTYVFSWPFIALFVGYPD